MKLKDDQIPAFLINANEGEKLTTGKGEINIKIKIKGMFGSCF